MNKNNIITMSGVASLFLLSASSVSAATYEVSSFAGGLLDSQGPVSTGTISSISTDPNGENLNWSGDARAYATANESGQSAVSADGLYACGLCEFDLYAEALYLTSYTNNTSSAVSFTYDFFINGPSVEVVDYAGIDQTSGLRAEAYAGVFMSTTGGVYDSMALSAQLFGGRVDHDFYSYGSTARYFEDGLGFGYRLDDFAGSFSGVLAAGETVTIDTEMYASIFGPGWELGAKASVGDPNNLSIGPGFSGSFNVSAVPVPAAVWLFGSGLIGLIGIARRRS